MFICVLHIVYRLNYHRSFPYFVVHVLRVCVNHKCVIARRPYQWIKALSCFNILSIDSYRSAQKKKYSRFDWGLRGYLSSRLNDSGSWWIMELNHSTVVINYHIAICNCHFNTVYRECNFFVLTLTAETSMIARGNFNDASCSTKNY